ncbi:hypothetical protein O1W71_02030 [Microbacterium sp. H37-C3]|uniref:hypothetical protein n=1 Tax=Microbacterium sp. H37-C3 TaxID=3004354 RepID=UPI0022AF568C|nr:hypothetical protein [Microbacterium sp. H37-C3]MCZ4066446.1 hypothetical protein [Microbacterium sp. H37-C3]
MGNAARKARKRAGIPHTRKRKQPTRAYSTGRPVGLGLVTPAEVMAAVLVRGLA